MAVTLDPNSPVCFVTKSDRELPVDQQTRFYILPLTRRELIKFTAMAGKSSEEQLEQMITLLKDKLVSWENLKDQSGKLVAFGNDKDANMDKLSMAILSELFEGLGEINGLTKDDQKN